MLGRVDTILGVFDDSDQVLTLHELTRPHRRSPSRPCTACSSSSSRWDGSNATSTATAWACASSRSAASPPAAGASPRRRSPTSTPCRRPPDSPCNSRFSTAPRSIYLHRVTASDFSLPTREGGRQPAHCTALGQGDARLRRGGGGRGPAPTTCLGGHPTPSPRPRRLSAELDEIAEPPVSPSIARRRYEGLACVAAPLRSTGRAIAAVSVTGPDRPVRRRPRRPEAPADHRGDLERTIPPPLSASRHPTLRHRTAAAPRLDV